MISSLALMVALSELQVKSVVEHIMSLNGRDVRNRLKEAMARIDELETQLDSFGRQKAMNEKQLEVQKNVIQELRKLRDNSVEWTEYQILKEDFDKNSVELTKSVETVDTLSKKLMTEEMEIEMLHQKCSQQSDQIHDLEKSLNQCMHTIDSQNGLIVEINDYKANQEVLRQKYDTICQENEELRELLRIYQNEDPKGDHNISVDDLNQSISNLSVDPLDFNSNGKTFDLVFDIKLADIQRALDEKKRLNEELNQKTKQMNEEIDRLSALRLEIETKTKQRDQYLVEKQSFDRVFRVVEDRLLSHIPLNQYFVPIGRRLLFSLTPKYLLRALP